MAESNAPKTPPHSLVFLSFKIDKVVFERESSIADGNFEIDVQFINEYPSQTTKSFFNTIYVVKIWDENKKTNFQLQAVGSFEIKEQVTDTVQDNYTLISAPSIVFPYIRAFISNLFVQVGAPVVMLPPINFAARYHDNKQKEVEENNSSENESE
jgi:preprotein translocase subunit SecB